MIMEHKGTKRLETERLILRPFTAEDGPAMYKNWTGDPEVTRFLTWPTHPSADVSAQLAAFWAEEAGKPDHYQWAVVLKDLNEPVGSLAVVSHWDDVAKCELGYCLGRAWWGRGLMTEAVKEVIRYLFREVGMNRIEASYDVHNPASGPSWKRPACASRAFTARQGKITRASSTWQSAPFWPATCNAEETPGTKGTPGC